MYIKKLYVLAALEVDFYKKKLVDATMTGQTSNTTRVMFLFISDIRFSHHK